MLVSLVSLRIPVRSRSLKVTLLAGVCWFGALCGLARAESREIARTKTAKDEAKEAAPQPAKRLLEITVLGPDEAPLAGAKVHAAIWHDGAGKSNHDYDCDDQGSTVVELPAGKIDILRLWARKPGHVAQFAQWWPKNEPVPREIPKNYAFQLDAGSVIGGVVKNDAGEPIVAARVEVMLINPNRERGLDQHPIPNTWLATGDEACITDANGAWSLENAPSDDPDVEFGFRILLNHPDYVSDANFGGLQLEQGVTAKSLREESAVVVMHKGVRLSGVVTNPEGKFVPDAVVVWGNDPYLQQGSQEVRTDAEGRYRLPPLPAGSIPVTVVAAGFAPDRQEIELVEGAEPVADFRLANGKPLRLRFVDETGTPISKVGVGIASWRGAKSLYNHKHPTVLDTAIPVLADENGVYEWTWAPNDAVVYTFYKQGYRGELPSVELIASDETEYKVTLRKTRDPNN